MPRPGVENTLKECFFRGIKRKTKRYSLFPLLVSPWAGTHCSNVVKNTKFAPSLISQRTEVFCKSVLFFPYTRYRNPPVWICEKWKPRSRFIHCWVPFLPSDQEISLCVPFPIVETNEDFYAPSTASTWHILTTPRDAFLCRNLCDACRDNSLHIISPKQGTAF